MHYTLSLCAAQKLRLGIRLFRAIGVWLVSLIAFLFFLYVTIYGTCSAALAVIMGICVVLLSVYGVDEIRDAVREYTFNKTYGRRPKEYL